MTARSTHTAFWQGAQRRRLSVVAVILAIVVAAVAAQTDAPPTAAQADASKPPRFEVTSVKANTSGRVLPALPRLTPGRMTVTNVGLRQLIQMSYRIPPFQLVGFPRWAETAYFDINATSSASATPDQLLAMVRGLLADRFQFVAHRETREVDVYTLVQVAPGSAKMKPSAVDCGVGADQPMDQALAAARGDSAAPQSGPAQQDAAGRGGQPRCTILPRTARGQLTATGARISHLTSVMQGVVGRLVIDKTGLTGAFDLRLSWTPEQPLQPNAVAQQPTADAPSIFTAIEEQLGLRLVAGRGPGEVLVVDRLEPPTSD